MLQFEDEISERLGLNLQNLDSNNNTSESDSRGDKYSLRPRSMRRKNVLNDFEEIPLCPQKSSGGSSKAVKTKSAPLSKYRRKTANARERSRMREINMAFEALRKAVPQIAPNQQQNEKLTKITTLRLAMKYISALSAALSSSGDFPAGRQDIFSECVELDSFLLESDGESVPVNSEGSEHSLTPQDFAVDFEDSLTSMDFSPDFSDHLHFDTFLTDFS
ncbi:helix-loop-helix protein delilah [Sitophilus oryzae]|uniref:Helix-loop-helix protein delilah n=1 Tax=Sitophilus oryzae TaxID=7048 RepID=A0A6J2YLP2_SITOR|nr:helix-loop-helix protein delilah [Sitophilus oryzae]